MTVITWTSTGFLLDLIFDLEDVGNMFIRNFGFSGDTTQNAVLIIACGNIKPFKEIIKHVRIIIHNKAYCSLSDSIPLRGKSE
jgi:hypothetical protein